MTQNANERFEELAAAFHAATGMIAPGKSVAPEMASDEYDRERYAKWAVWLRDVAPLSPPAPRTTPDCTCGVSKALAWADSKNIPLSPSLRHKADCPAASLSGSPASTDRVQEIEAALFTDEHRNAIGLACEKLWNGEPAEDPICSPRHKSHPLVKVGNAALQALNAADAELVRLEQKNSDLLARVRSLEAENADLRRHVAHGPDCVTNIDGSCQFCYCGLSDLLAALPSEAPAPTPSEDGVLACARCGGTQHFYRREQCPKHVTTPDVAVTATRCLLDVRHDGPCVGPSGVASPVPAFGPVPHCRRSAPGGTP